MKTAITLIIGLVVGFGLSVLYSGSDAERIVRERQAEVVGSVASTFMARQSDPVHELFLKGDRYHPNREGYRIVAGEVVKLVVARKLALIGD